MIARIQIVPLLIAVILYAPALKARFSFTDIALYIGPGALLVLSVLINNYRYPHLFFNRLACSLIFLIPFLPAYIAFFVSGGGDFDLLVLYGANCALGSIILINVWNRQSFEVFLLMCVCLGLLLSMDSLINYRSFDSLLDASEFVRQKYLPVAFASGVSCLAALYLFATRSSSVYMFIFALNWIGLALSRGRGAVIFCAIFTFVYLIYLLFVKSEVIGKFKRYFIIGVVLSLAPIVISNLKVLNTGKWTRLVSDIDSELDQGGRGALMQDAVSKISESPAIGSGLGEYLIDGAHPHNILLQFGMDAGFVGIALLLLFCFLVVWFVRDAIKQSSGEHSSALIILLLLFCYSISNYMKSGDAYLGRDWIILAALPVSLCLHLAYQRKYRNTPMNNPHHSYNHSG